MALFREDRKLSTDPRSPERSYLALSRLIPWLRPGRRSDASVDAHFYTSKPGQNPFEIRLVSSLFNLTWTLLLCGAASHLFDIGPFLAPIVFVLAGFGTLLIIIVVMCLAELVTRLIRRVGGSPSGVLVQSAAHQIVLLVACIEASFDSHWVRWVGIGWLTLVALELIAQAIEMVLPERERERFES